MRFDPSLSTSGGTRPLLAEIDAAGKTIGGGEGSVSIATSATAAGLVPSASTFEIPGVGKAAIKDKTLGKETYHILALDRFCTLSPHLLSPHLSTYAH